MSEKIYTNTAPEPIGPYSQGIRAGEVCYLSGQVPIDPATGELVAGGIAEQTEQACKNVKALVEAAGGTMDNIVKAGCFLLTMDDFAAFNEVYARYFTSEPARFCVAVAGLPKGALVEIETTAVI